MTILNIVDCVPRVGLYHVWRKRSKYNTHGQAKYNHDGRFTCTGTRNKCSALVQYIMQVLCMNITKTKYNRHTIVLCLSNVITHWKLTVRKAFSKLRKDYILTICSSRPFQVGL